MRFYEITPTKIIDLKTVRTAQVIDDEIWISFNCGTDKTERAMFRDSEEALSAYKALVAALYDM